MFYLQKRITKKEVNNISIKEIIEQIPYILQYFVPGFIILSLYCFMESKPINNGTYTIGFSVLSSYIISVIVSMGTGGNTLITLIIEIIIAIIIGLLSSKVVRSEAVKMVLSEFTEKDMEDNMLRKVMDFELGTILQLYDKNQNLFYTGALFMIDERDTEPWVSLIDYSIYKIEDDGTLEDIPLSPRKEKLLVLKLSNISRMELVYEKNTKVLQWYNSKR